MDVYVTALLGCENWFPADKQVQCATPHCKIEARTSQVIAADIMWRNEVCVPSYLMSLNNAKCTKKTNLLRLYYASTLRLRLQIKLATLLKVYWHNNTMCLAKKLPEGKLFLSLTESRFWMCTGWPGLQNLSSPFFFLNPQNSAFYGNLSKATESSKYWCWLRKGRRGFFTTTQSRWWTREEEREKAVTLQA